MGFHWIVPKSHSSSCDIDSHGTTTTSLDAAGGLPPSSLPPAPFCVTSRCSRWQEHGGEITTGSSSLSCATHAAAGGDLCPACGPAALTRCSCSVRHRCWRGALAWVSTSTLACPVWATMSPAALQMRWLVDVGLHGLGPSRGGGSLALMTTTSSPLLCGDKQICGDMEAGGRQRFSHVAGVLFGGARAK
uniref:Uncharacterized protein n=1 Tax=Oryza meridionalis TaxID=40149 RepID=A0A0E0CPX0_9ORYZ